MLNREIYFNDPLQSHLANEGVATVKDDLTKLELDILEYELRTFVCNGAYATGLEKILKSYIASVEKNAKQPCVWISGFFGSGKSHLAKMARALWTNQTLNNGQTARSIVDLPSNIETLFDKLSTLATKHNGVHAASGTLSSSAGKNVRLAFLSIIFKSVGLPEQYHLARFVMWLKEEGIYNQVREYVATNAKKREGKDPWEHELKNLHMSPVIGNAILNEMPDFAPSPIEVSKMIRSQYQQVKDVSNNEMVTAVIDAIAVNGELPLTLVVLDEVQQYIGDDIDTAMAVQELGETCGEDGRLNSKLLFIGTGQSALTSTENLQRLMGRFTVNVQLQETDVDSVIRKVILQKNENARSAVQTVINNELGEISRHLRGSTIEHNKDDEKWMVADYPLLPVRRRFWEKVLPALDKTGTGSQLRNQLRIVHEATKTTAEKPLGCVVPADYIYDQIATKLLNSGAIGKDIYETISRLKAGDNDQKLQSRLLALILLISKLPTDIESGIAATADTLSDLLLENLQEGKHELRALVPKLLNQLVDDGLVMPMQTSVGEEYRLQTVESQQWYDMYRQQENELKANPQKLEYFRSQEIQQFVRKQVAQARITQGDIAEPRPINLEFGAELPSDADKKLYAWAPEVPEKNFNALARGADPDSATIYIHVPTSQRDELRKAIVELKAAETTIDVRGTAKTDAGKEAYAAMEYRFKEADRAKKAILKDIFSQIQVKLAGGQEVEGENLAEQIQNAGKLASQRLYSKFKMADNKGWAKVYNRASTQGDPNALEAIDHNDEADKHPVCSEIKRFIGLVKTGKEIIDHFKDAPYGWGKDTIEGALFAMVAAGVLNAKDGQERPVDAKSLDRSSVTQTKFRPENVTLSKLQIIKVRGLINALLPEGQNCGANEEQSKLSQAITNAKNVARSAGGEAPLPLAPSTTILTNLEMYDGNEQLQQAYESKDEIQSQFIEWQEQADLAKHRVNQWNELKTASRLCKDLAIYSAITEQMDSIESNRSLLAEPNPISPLLKQAESALRDAITAKLSEYEDEFNACHRDLMDDTNWAKLDDAKKQALLEKRSLSSIPSINLSSPAAVYDAIEVTSFEQWNDRISALPGRFDAALKDAISELAPKVKHIRLNKPMLESEDDLKAWLTDVETQLRSELANGPVVPS
ncbi:BREX system P-loop protein BrxC [Pseudoalteromonas sp. SR43-3]|uniref:BREX system P-loop protein BrxC n=1 Tax=Pseudoalteromonas sp. SR43-3 TaxID=2760943 RepID=UPI00160040A3|nr:BREX system P-loop protein BrxC [Pseudoalteromonas sp. SR43-3]MBB1277061.1 BREX system P-loop protein BrxC [Pseudoalteromonas sp. SR43-3]